MQTFAVEQFQTLLPCSLDKAKQVEKALFELCKDLFQNIEQEYMWDFELVRQTYRKRLYKVLSNLHMSHSILKQVLAAADTVEDYKNIFSMDFKTFAPHLWNYSEEKQEEKETVDVMDSLIECMNCKRKGQECRNVTFEQRQTRSGDEGMTVYATCHNCGKRWKS